MTIKSMACGTPQLQVEFLIEVLLEKLIDFELIEGDMIIEGQQKQPEYVACIAGRFSLLAYALIVLNSAATNLALKDT